MPALRNEDLSFDTLFSLTIDIRQYLHVCFAKMVTSGFTLYDLARIP